MMADMPAGRTAVDIWRNRVASSRDQQAFRYPVGGEWRAMTWGEADAAAQEIAAGLAFHGVGRGDAVCIISQTRLEWMLCDVATLLLGGVVVPIYASNTAEQCAFIIKDAGVKVAFVEDAAQLEKLLPLAVENPGLKFVTIGGDAKLEKPEPDGRTSVKLADVLSTAQTPPISLDALRAAGRKWSGAIDTMVNPDDLFTIIYTSGTTGTPKGVELTHQNLVAAVESACRAFTLRPDDEELIFLPLAHVLARELAWVIPVVGARLVFCESLAKLKDNLAAIRPTFMGGVPRVYEKFYSAVNAGAKQGSAFKVRLVAWAFSVGQKYAAELRAGRKPGLGLSWRHSLADKLVLSKLRAKLGLDRCRFLISGGAPLAAEIAEFFHGVGLLVLEGYGLTETMAATFVNTVEKYRFGTVGPAIDVVECKFADDGEILMRGPSVFRRYRGNPAATAEAIDGDGWFHSGDIGMLEDGFLRITDRKKDLIVTAGGKKIAPQMLENALKARSSLVSQVMVYGDKHPYIVALVTLNEEALKRFGNADAPEARAALQKDIDAVNGKVASYESIKTFAILPVDFTEAGGELTPSMKIKRKVVTERFAADIAKLYGESAA